MTLISEKTILTVSRLTALLRDVLEENFMHVWVEGEVSNVSFPSSGHIYFTLKDNGASLRCVMFRGSGKNLRFRPEDGMALIARGRISVYDQRGDYQLLCDYIEPAGTGALQTAFIQLKNRLAKEGLFEADRKRKIPPYPQRVGIVTSPTGAAIQDILNVLKRRFASLDVIIYPVRVQGDGAAEEIAAALDEMNRMRLADVLIVARGGGSIEDLWAFNEEVVARAIYRSRIPVISAVGHETDWSISDFAADLRAPTPSAAAEMVVASTDEQRSRIEGLSHRLRLAVEKHISGLEAKLSSLKRVMQDPSRMMKQLSQRVDDLSERLDNAIKNSLSGRRERFARVETSLIHLSPVARITFLGHRINQLSGQMERTLIQKIDMMKQNCYASAAQLEVLSPLATLSRGYVLARKQDSCETITRLAGLSPGERVKLSFLDGDADCLVESVELKDEKTSWQNLPERNRKKLPEY